MGMDATAEIWFGPKSREASDDEINASEVGDGYIRNDSLPPGVTAGCVHYEGADAMVFLCTERHRFNWDYGDQAFVPQEPSAETRAALVVACARHGFDARTIGWHCLCNYR